MSLEAWGDEGDIGPDGYVTDERAQEMVQEALREVLVCAMRIVQGGWDGDRKKVLAYARMLAAKLDYHSTDAAKWLTKKLDALESGTPEITITTKENPAPSPADGGKTP